VSSQSLVFMRLSVTISLIHKTLSIGRIEILQRYWKDETLDLVAVFGSTGAWPLSRPRSLAGVAGDTRNVHTPIMTLKNAALLALIGTILTTALLVWTFVFHVLNALRGLVPTVTLFSSFIYAFGCFGVTMFLYVFHRSQS
jgi:hypothetical protein